MKNKKTVHQWKVLAVSCIDGRFIKKIIDWIADKTDDVFDFNTEVGDSKAIIESKEDRGVLFEVINTSIKLHKIKEVWLFDHVDCGAYGGSRAFKSEKTEKAFHKQKLDRTEKIIIKKFPKIKVKKFYVGWDEISRI